MPPTAKCRRASTRPTGPNNRCHFDRAKRVEKSPYMTQFTALLEESVGAERAATVLEALQAAPSVSVRLNPEKLRTCPFPDATPVAWSPHGYLLKERPVFTLDPLFHAGAYYVQDTSAMFVGHVFRALPLAEGATVLDLCAAPGGKTTDLAASLRERLGDRFTLLSNEVMRARYGVLRSNVETWGDPRVGTVSRDPSAFGNTPLFDVIVADVPCSGEGMFRKDAQAVAEWSPQTVEFCAARSRRILRDIWGTLKSLLHLYLQPPGKRRHRSLGGGRTGGRYRPHPGRCLPRHPHALRLCPPAGPGSRRGTICRRPSQTRRSRTCAHRRPFCPVPGRAPLPAGSAPHLGRRPQDGLTVFARRRPGAARPGACRPAYHLLSGPAAGARQKPGETV